ncbi:tail fiber protein [Escherichia coli]|uniref:Tail fiber protein n=1 Tax=Escherichia coli TaxID=562 RepID=A0A376ZFY9_ECOLX|nr:tail fiber protein [Escherichia coli]
MASENPDEAGRYSMDVEYGQYSVILLVEGFPPSHAGTITVYEDSQPGTLNDFLGAMSEDDVRPEALRRFELMVGRSGRVTLRRRRRMPERRRRQRGMPAYQPVRRKRARQMLTLQQGGIGVSPAGGRKCSLSKAVRGCVLVLGFCGRSKSQ